MYCNVKLCERENKKVITAIIDTGNFLKDPITKIPVIVAEINSLDGLFPSEILHNASKIINGGDIDLGEYASKIRVIPFKSLGKDNGLLLGIKIDKAYIEIYKIGKRSLNSLVYSYCNNIFPSGVQNNKINKNKTIKEYKLPFFWPKTKHENKGISNIHNMLKPFDIPYIIKNNTIAIVSIVNNKFTMDCLKF